jgi:F-type H+-transporting ATPase subunit b
MNFNPSTFIFELINFMVLVYILRRVLYRPLHEMIDRRREVITRAQEEADEARRRAQELQRQLEEKISEADEQRQQMLSQVRDEAEGQRRKLLARAEQEAQQRLEDARRAIELERRDAQDALQADLVRDALQVTERLLAAVSSPTVQRQLVGRLISTLDALSVPEQKQLARAWKPDGRAILECAVALDRPDLEAVRNAVGRIIGSQPLLTVQTHAELISGVRLRLDGHVWDASLAGQLEGAANHGQ